MPSLEERGAIERTFHWVTHYATWRGGAGGAPPVVTMGDKHGGQRFVRTASATTAAATTAATTAGGSPGGKTRPGGKARPGGGGGHTADRRLGAMATSPRRTLPPAPPGAGGTWGGGQSSGYGYGNASPNKSLSKAATPAWMAKTGSSSNPALTLAMRSVMTPRRDAVTLRLMLAREIAVCGVTRVLSLSHHPDPESLATQQ